MSDLADLSQSFDTILILDFGSQYSHLITRRPYSVYDDDAPHVDPAIFELGIPILGVCYGMQEIAWHFGRNVLAGEKREYGLAEVDIKRQSGVAGHVDKLLQGLTGPQQVFMSHGDKLSHIPESFAVIAATRNTPFAGIAHDRKLIYGVQFHPEVSHTPQGTEILRNFAVHICEARQHWTMDEFVSKEIAQIRALVGEKGQVIGAVAAKLMDTAIGNRFHAVLIDNGLLRKGEAVSVKKTLTEQLGIQLAVVDASDRFLEDLKGVTDPEKKRKIIGSRFIQEFQDKAKELERAAAASEQSGKIQWLLQGTLWPDVIETSFGGPSQTIKSHHNVSLPAFLKLKLIEPLRLLFKDEVRVLGTDSNLGPGLAIRILGDVTATQLKIARDADHIFISEMEAHGLYHVVSQAFAALIPTRAVGVMGDKRSVSPVRSKAARIKEFQVTSKPPPTPVSTELKENPDLQILFTLQQPSYTGNAFPAGFFAYTSPEAEERRGRQLDRDRSSTTKEDDDSGNEKQNGIDEPNGKPRKRKRSRKGLEKNFPCPHPGCGKSYSRAEHLYRHQLNHQPKKIYVCDHPSSRGSHLQRKDNALRGSDPAPSPPHPSHVGLREQQGNNGYSLHGGQQEQSSPPPRLAELPGQRSNLALKGSRGDELHYGSPTGALESTNTGQAGLGNDTYPSPQGFPPFASLPPPAFGTSQPSLQSTQSTYPNAISSNQALDTAAGYDAYAVPNLPGVDPMMENGSNAYQMPFYNEGSYCHSPRNSTEDFVNFLFNETSYPQAASPGGPRQSSMSFGTTAFMEDYGQFGLGYDLMNGPSGPNIPQQHPMALNNILDPASLHAILSDEKRRDVLKLIENRFTDDAPVSKQKEELLWGDRDADGHVLSLRQMQLYIRSYWYHFHPQMPILHKPTFSANEAKELLLIAVIAIGASCLDKMHGADVTEAGADLANFLAWHLRGEVFKHKDFSPPAQLWIFQTLLLLEVYEKMYSTRTLHERAHIHHGTTLTLMRRGSSLIGRSPLDSPPTENAASENSVDHTTTMNNTPEQWWNHWVTNEATRRVAFAAFIIDSIHATMFGHQATMVAHEMKLALPCDESLWSAGTSAEVAKKEADLRAKGTKSMTFFDGLKNTLKGKQVQTNPFGRMAIMAGLLSVTWHMNQRDVQIHHLGALKALGGKDVWRSPLTKAFDSWKQDFDSSMSKENFSLSYSAAKLDEENIFESRVVLHHLSHMAMHVDIVSCQIFAGARRLLGRTTLQSDYDIAQKRIRLNWAPRASARHATYYALKFLAQVLLPDPGAAYSSPTGFTPYSARDDFLLNRPWVLYYAILVVWSYGFALDGPIKEPPDLASHQEQAYDMRQFLTKFGSIQAPLDLGNMKDRNACLGLLYVLHDKFRKCRWQLLHEAANLLNNCINKLRGHEEKMG
ncbi:uncharacterized protein KY384_003273 [Bacidia gigantensis]|uniref:uncharacterized protein n=1 Tax=Bacidia gigantensis TaxID=2732470 RepID=UPI001D05969B|nr:uncharacterized protein KY384_003273 [Bacidia gigantensis]KAG8531642.1 hypothetical protein KY384_003273 [Bacidia gigantensis]